MTEIRVPKKIVNAPYWSLGDHFLRFDEAQGLTPEQIADLFASLGLGTMATLDIGDHGLASPNLLNTAPWPNATLDNISGVVTGSYYVTFEGGAGGPLPSGNYGVVEVWRRSSSHILMIFRNINGRSFVRYSTTGGVTWSAWVESVRAGDFGLGAVGVETPLLTDFHDASLPNGFYRWEGVQTANAPVASTGGGAIKFMRSNGVAAWLASRTAAGATSEPFFYVKTTYSSSPILWGPWRHLFHSGNVVGVVSQSGGVPTGAIIERGSNSDGEFVRFADGTQICMHTTVLSTPLTARGNVFFSGTSIPFWDFPASFISPPSGSVSNTASDWQWYGVISAANNRFRPQMWSSAAGNVNIPVRMIAIGRWF